eukprot:1312002-Amphidinium_carterae.2
MMLMLMMMRMMMLILMLMLMTMMMMLIMMMMIMMTIVCSWPRVDISWQRGEPTPSSPGLDLPLLCIFRSLLLDGLATRQFESSTTVYLCIASSFHGSFNSGIRAVGSTLGVSKARDAIGHGQPRAVGGRDPPPSWNGESPGQWRQVRRDLLLWSADTDLAPQKRAVRFYRQLSGRARLLADGLADNRLMAQDGLQYVINHFDVIYKDTLEVEKELEGEKALDRRPQTRTLLPIFIVVWWSLCAMRVCWESRCLQH